MNIHQSQELLKESIIKTGIYHTDNEFLSNKSVSITMDDEPIILLGSSKDIEVHKYGPNESPKIENHVFSDDEYENKKIFLSHKIQELSNRFSLNNENTEENHPEKKSSLKFK